jgi:hypothetical protein
MSWCVCVVGELACRCLLDVQRAACVLSADSAQVLGQVVV